MSLAVTRLFLILTLAGSAALAGCSNNEVSETPGTSPGTGETLITESVDVTPTPEPTPTPDVPPPPEPTPNRERPVPSPTSPPPEPTPTRERPVPSSTPEPAEAIAVELDTVSNAFVIEGAEVRLQFLEVFEAVRCPARGRCIDLGAAIALIGISGPGVFPIIVELALGTPVYGVAGYDLMLKWIDRGDSGDAVLISITDTGVGLSGGVLATFGIGEETFRIWVTNRVTADRIVALGKGEIAAVFPLGPLRPGPGEANHNQPHRWHLDPEATKLAEMGAAPCDAPPSALDNNREFWLDTLGTYCPQSAELVDVQDLRPAPAP